MLAWIRSKANTAFATPPLSWVGGFDLDHLPFHQDRDGTSTVAALAFFLAAQGVAFGVGVKDKGGDIVLWILYPIYAIIFLLTFFGIVRILRLTQPLSTDVEPARPAVPGAREAASAAPSEMRAYDRATIHFGRWCLLAAFILLVILGISSSYGILPGQEPVRKAYIGDVPVDTSHVYQAAPSNIKQEDSLFSQEVKLMAKWVDWLVQGAGGGVSETTKFLWIEQRDPFDAKYDSFKAQLKFKTRFATADTVAFLVRPDEGSSRLIYRQLKMDIVERDGAPASATTFTIIKPEPGERLLLIVKLNARPEETLPSETREIQAQIVNLTSPAKQQENQK